MPFEHGMQKTLVKPSVVSAISWLMERLVSIGWRDGNGFSDSDGKITKSALDIL